jgi:hypothetical protein
MGMIAEKTKYGQGMFSGAKIEHSCPDCGGVLREVERTNENDVSFFWYKCSRPDCSGGWLEKRIAAIKDY